jgi:hypothetical protein
MNRLFRLLLQLCLFRLAPQDLPYSPRLAQGLVLLGVGINLLFVRMLDAGAGAAGRIALSLALLLGLPWLLLSLRRRLPRYTQTLTALAGSGVLFLLALLPLAQPIASLPPPSATSVPSTAHVVISLLSLLLLLWKLAINAHIWRHALDWPRGGAIVLTLGLFLFELALVRTLVGSAAAA